MRTALLLAATALSILATGCCTTAASNPDTVMRPAKVTRIGMVVGIKPEKIEEYKKLHAECWPGVLQALKECNYRNFSIYIAEIEPGKYYLFGYLEYWGTDIAADQKKAESYEINKKWWKLTDACQVKVPMNKKKGLWMGMEEVFHAE